MNRIIKYVDKESDWRKDNLPWEVLKWSKKEDWQATFFSPLANDGEEDGGI